MSTWEEHRKVVEYRLDQTDKKIDTLSGHVQELTGSFAALEERSKHHGGVWGAITGFLTGLAAWLAWLIGR